MIANPFDMICVVFLVVVPPALCDACSRYIDLLALPVTSEPRTIQDSTLGGKTKDNLPVYSLLILSIPLICGLIMA